jgi:rhodanese-related sulfurtransferase
VAMRTWLDHRLPPPGSPSRPGRRPPPAAGILLLALIAAALAAGCGGESSSSEGAAAAQGYPTVAPKEVAGDVEEGRTLLVDVREDDEWRAGRAPAALHVPLATVGDRISAIERRADGRPVAFICRSGSRSAEAAEVAVDAGLEHVLNVGGGMAAWVDAGLPIVPADGRVL